MWRKGPAGISMAGRDTAKGPAGKATAGDDLILVPGIGFFNGQAPGPGLVGRGRGWF